MQYVQFIIQPAFGFMNPINEYWSHQYHCAMQFYLNENSARFGCREEDSFVLLCLSLAALKRCFANHIQRLQLPHHLSRSPGNVCLPPSVWQSNLCPAGCLLKAEQPNSIPLTLSAVSFLQSQRQSCKVSSLNFSPGFMCHRSLAAEISHFWERQSPSCLTGENRNILPGLLLSSQWQVNQTEAALPKMLLHKSGLFWQYCTRQLCVQQLPHIPMPRRTFQRWRFQSSLFSFYTLLFQLEKWHYQKVMSVLPYNQ